MAASIHLPALLLAAIAFASPLAAQSWRVSITPLVGTAWSSPVFEHHERSILLYPSAGGGPVEYARARRLTVGDATTAGARAEYRFTARWTAFAEGTYGRTALRYVESSSLTPQGGMDALPSSERFERRNDATVSAFALGVARGFTLGHPSLELGLGTAASLRTLSMQRETGARCLSYVAQCRLADPWAARYAMPGVAGSAALRWALTPSFGVEARSMLSAERANVASFRTACASPDLDGTGCPPRTRWVRGMQLGLGLSVRR